MHIPFLTCGFSLRVLPESWTSLDDVISIFSVLQSVTMALAQNTVTRKSFGKQQREQTRELAVFCYSPQHRVNDRETIFPV